MKDETIGSMINGSASFLQEVGVAVLVLVVIFIVLAVTTSTKDSEEIKESLEGALSKEKKK
ncbi:MAG: hypothetical protein ACRBBP_07825 [Bdellovibrionales bacterium]